MIRRLLALAALLAVAAGCSGLTDEQRCQQACAPRAMHEVTLWSCVCESTAMPDGGR